MVERQAETVVIMRREIARLEVRAMSPPTSAGTGARRPQVQCLGVAHHRRQHGGGAVLAPARDVEPIEPDGDVGIGDLVDSKMTKLRQDEPVQVRACGARSCLVSIGQRNHA